MKLTLIASVIATSLIGGVAQAYPLDSYEETGIRRLDFYNLAQQRKVNGRILHQGARLNSYEIQLSLQGDKELPLPGPDPILTNQICDLLPPKERKDYQIALLDYSSHPPRYAEFNAKGKGPIGSVGKLLVAGSYLNALAEFKPEIVDRVKALKSQVVSTSLVNGDKHDVPLWDVKRRKLKHRPLKKGDVGNVWEYLDWMLSASSNAAASMIMKEMTLLQQFGEAYPLDPQFAKEHWKESRGRDLGHEMRASVDSMLYKHDFDPKRIRQASMFTGTGKRQSHGRRSYGNVRDLMRLLFKMEQGRLVDAWSSLELKRLLYMTQKRIRYSSHPIFKNSAVYFKSGSLYSCTVKPCEKYKGDRYNHLASVAMVEEPADQPINKYAVIVMSNVLKKNSAIAHQTLAGKIHRLIRKNNANPDRKIKRKYRACWR